MSSGVPRATLGSLVVGDACPVAIIGVLNVSPESFYGGSIHTEPDDLVRAADAMVAAGAGILDVGGMSTAPYLPTSISEAEEGDRLARAVGRLATKYEVPISVDTFRSGPARAALDAGAATADDVTGPPGDPGTAARGGGRGAGVSLMAHRAPGGLPTAGRRAPIEAVSRALVESLALARGAGIADERIVLDPGIGFIRDGHLPWYEWDAAIIAHLDELRALGRPVCVGVSRKSFIGALAGRDRPADRLAGSLAATAVAVRPGAALVRTHDVAESRDAVRVASALRP